jgi:hypothetical protein
MSLRKRLKGNKIHISNEKNIDVVKQRQSYKNSGIVMRQDEVYNDVSNMTSATSSSTNKINEKKRQRSKNRKDKRVNIPSNRTNGVTNNIQRFCTYQIVFYSILLLVVINYSSQYYRRNQYYIIHRERVRKLSQLNVSGKELMIETAKLYQNHPDLLLGANQQIDSFRYWAQDIGLSYFEYYRGRYYTPKESEGIQHSQCFSWPDPRVQFTFLAVSTRSTFTGSGNMIMTPYALAYGGWDGGVRDDMWLFIRGLIDGVQIYDAELDKTRKFAFIPKNLQGDSLAQACEEKNPLLCNRCGRWHKLNPQPEGRGLTDCRYYQDEIIRSLNQEKATLQHTQWCPEAFDRYSGKSKQINIGRFAHASAFAYRDKAVMNEGIMVTFGGETKTLLSNSVWYLAKMPISETIVNEPTYSDDYASDFLCLRVYGNDEVYPPRRICPKKSVFTEVQGELHSGKLLPQSECLWTIEPNVTFKDYIIVLDVLRLDMDNPPFVCESYITIKDTDNTTTIDKYNFTHQGTTLFHGCSTKTMPITRFAAVNGKMIIKMYYENMCPSHSGFDANYTVYNIEDKTIYCDTLEECNRHGDCLAGKCFCHHEYYGKRCESKCNPRDAACIKNELFVEAAFPQPRSGHVAISMFAESYTKVVHRTYAREILEPVAAKPEEMLSAQGDVAMMYAQDCCPCHIDSRSPCFINPDTGENYTRCYVASGTEDGWRDGCSWNPKFTMQRTINLQREIQSFICSATKAPAPDSQGKAQNKLNCYAENDPQRISGRQDAVRVRKRDIPGFPADALGDVCRSTWQFPDKFKLAFDCESKKAEIDANPQLKWGDAWSNSRICKNVTDWIPQNAIAQEVEAEFLRAFGQKVIVTINLGYTATLLTGGGAEKVEAMEWHDSVNFGGGCKGAGEQRCNIKTKCGTDGDNSISSVFCIANTGTDEYNQQCVCENNDPMDHLPEVCSKMGTNVVTIEWENVPECHGKDAKLPFCDLPELYMTEKESDLTISFTNQAQADSDCQYEATFCGCECKKDGISPYYVIMKGNKSREVFYNDITQVDSYQENSQYNEMNESRIVNDSLWTEPIRVLRSKIDFIMPANVTSILQRNEKSEVLCSQTECANVCADRCPEGQSCILPLSICADDQSSDKTGCGYSTDSTCYIGFWDAWECGNIGDNPSNCFRGPKYHTKYTYEKFIISQQFQLRDTNEVDGKVTLFGNKTSTRIASDSYESNSSTWGEGAQIVIFGGWNGNQSLNDLWVLSIQEQLGNEAVNRTCKTKIVGTGNDYHLIQVESSEYITRPRFGFEIGDIDYMPCSNVNWTKHAFYPNFHKINKWRKIDENVTGTAPAPRYYHTTSKWGSYMQGNGYSKDRYRMLLFGGYNDIDGTGRNDLWELTLPAKNQSLDAFKWIEVITFGDIPTKRWHQAMSPLRRDWGNYLFVYGGWNGHQVLNDIYMITLDSPYNTTLIWQEYTNTRGSWHMTHFAIPFLPFDSLAGLPGFKGYHILEQKLPIRYGHGLISLTSSFDGVNETRDILMSWSGAQESEMSTGLNADQYNLFWGGKATAGYYICPDVDIACSHPTYKGVGGLIFSFSSLRASHILSLMAFVFANREHVV